MLRKDIVKYVGEELKKGLHINVIKRRLVRAGHKIEHIEEAISHHHNIQHLDRVVILLFSVIVVVILVALYHADFEDFSISNRIEPEESYGSIVKTAVENKDVSDCDILDGVEARGCRESYYTSLALLTGDKSLCDNLEDSAVKEFCKTR
ncbi:MAG: hypothetical protein U9O94_07425 [Nanoarchaeota archaeon]|nr:hypothetical protein [Nanoarchaeota archaeon]